ncbi:MAG: Gfo/Idh/MocA family oxidoreductase [Nitrososphaerota archaeon]
MIGTGVGANLCAQALFTISKSNIAQLIAVTSQKEGHAKEFASKWNLKSWYTDYIKMLQKEDLDAVIINTPHYLHYKIAMDVMKMNKHVLVDKPMAISLKETDEMINEARKRNVKLGVILQSRFDSAVKKVKEAIDTGKFGRLILGEAVVEWFREQEYYDKSSWRGKWSTEGGGALINQAIHTIDLLLWLFGQPKQLWAQIDTFLHNIEVEDLAVAAIRFENGALGIIQASTAIYPGLPAKLEVHGTKGTAIIEGEILKRLSIMEEKEVISEKTKDKLESWVRPERVPVMNHASLIKDFAQSIIDDRKPYVDGIEGRKSIELIMAIYKSSKTNSIINFPFEEN